GGHGAGAVAEVPALAAGAPTPAAVASPATTAATDRFPTATAAPTVAPLRTPDHLVASEPATTAGPSRRSW
ncbi:hypothetical protein AB0G13_04010, partial [Micromonospora sp. NPDC023633]